MNKLVVSNINKSYDKKNLVLKDVSFSIQEGTFVVIVGPSGCGKSTLLSVIAGVEPLDSGNIFIDGVLSNEIRPQKRDVAMVFQNYALYPTMNVYENIAFPLKNRKVKKNVIKESVLKIATLLRIEKSKDKVYEPSLTHTLFYALNSLSQNVHKIVLQPWGRTRKQ